MDTRTMIKMLKDRIKGLVALQKKTKRARKTTLPQEERKALLAELEVTHPEWLHGRVMARRAEITACLNFYHEIRGSEYRHGVREGLEYEYKEVLDGLRRQLVQT